LLSSGNFRERDDGHTFSSQQTSFPKSLSVAKTFPPPQLSHSRNSGLEVPCMNGNRRQRRKTKPRFQTTMVRDASLTAIDSMKKRLRHLPRRSKELFLDHDPREVKPMLITRDAERMSSFFRQCDQMTRPMSAQLFLAHVRRPRSTGTRLTLFCRTMAITSTFRRIAVSSRGFH